MKKDSYRASQNNILNWLETSLSFRAIRKGLMLSIPFLLIGSFCLVMISWPIPEVNEFIEGLAGGLVYKFLRLVYKTTMGMIVFPIIIGVSYSYAGMIRSEYSGCFIMTSLLNFLILATPKNMSLSFDMFSTIYVFTALLVTLLTCGLLRFLFQLGEKLFKQNYFSGLDPELQFSLTGIVPIIISVLVVLGIRLIFGEWIGIDINNFGTVLMKHLFSKVGTGFLGAVVYIVIIHALWFFGIHGDNMLSYAAYFMFEAGMAENMRLVAAGEPATHLFTKTFFDAMLLIGGSGTTLCLIIAMAIGSKQKAHKKLFKLSIIPALFNINEVVIFGLPIAFNPILIIPFILTPLVLLLFDALVMYIGLVPYISQSIEWTTPIFFSGYFSTGSIRGALLQFVNLLIGTAIYMPFVKWYERHTGEVLKNNVKALTDEMMESEKNGSPIDLSYEGNANRYNVVKMLERDLDGAIRKDEITLHFQPQMKSDDSLYGVEALLRWNHPSAGYIYPPLVIALAKHQNLLDKLGLRIIDKAAAALQEISKHVDEPMNMSVNISPAQLENPKFKEQVVNILQKYDFGKCTLCFEVTEQIALVLTGRATEQMKELKDLGIPFHMDDFGMGHSSMVYLQKNEFSVVKLDGSLVREIVNNTRSIDIIRGIQEMAAPLHYITIAEYVETKEQVDLLRQLGCEIYQGWYFSKAIPFDELKEYLKQNNLYVE